MTRPEMEQLITTELNIERILLECTTQVNPIS